MTTLARKTILVCAACMISAGMTSASEKGEVQTLTVQEAVRLTLARSPEILVAEAQAASAREAVRESRASNRPRVFAGSGLAYNNGFPLSIEGAAPSIFQISASQPIFSKTNANLIREAEESGKAGQFGTEAARHELASRTASVYYEVFQAGRIHALLSAKLDAAAKQLKQIETLLEAGKVLPLESTVAKTAVLAARQQILVSQEQALIAERELHILTGLPDDIKIRTVEPQIDSPVFELQEDVLLQRAMEASPRIQKAQADVRAKEFHVEAERGGYLPQIDIVGQYALLSRANNYEDYFSQFMRNNFLAGISIQVPIFNGATGARVAHSRQVVSEARYKLESMKSDLRLSIQRGLGDLRIARGAVDLARSDANAAREMLEVREILMEAGRIGEKELEESNSQLLLKELSLLDADQMLFQRKLSLLHITGTLAAAMQ